MRARSLLVPSLALLVALAHGAQTTSRLSVIALDENGIAVPSARVTLQPPSPALVLRCETEVSGSCEFLHAPQGPVQLQVEKEGYYSAISSIEPTVLSEVEVTLHHLKEIKETVDVRESPPMIEGSQTASQERLTGMDIINVPYPSSHDYRNVLNYIPTVFVDPYAQVHVAVMMLQSRLSLSSCLVPMFRSQGIGQGIPVLRLGGQSVLVTIFD